MTLPMRWNRFTQSYQKALDNLASTEEADYYVCNVCGMTVENEAPDACPVCGAPASAFMKIY